MGNESKEEEEVITCREFLEKHKDIKEEELQKIVLVCKNCEHKDLLKNFLKDRERANIFGGNDYTPKPIDPSPSPFPSKPPYRWNPTITGQTLKASKVGTATSTANPIKKGNKMMMVILENRNYEDMFYCPKCGSSLVVLCKEFLKNNVARLL